MLKLSGARTPAIAQDSRYLRSIIELARPINSLYYSHNILNQSSIARRGVASTYPQSSLAFAQASTCSSILARSLGVLSSLEPSAETSSSDRLNREKIKGWKAQRRFFSLNYLAENVFLTELHSNIVDLCTRARDDMKVIFFTWIFDSTWIQKSRSSPRISSAAEGYSEKFNKLIIGVWSPENGGIVIILFGLQFIL